MPLTLNTGRKKRNHEYLGVVLYRSINSGSKKQKTKAGIKDRSNNNDNSDQKKTMSKRRKTYMKVKKLMIGQCERFAAKISKLSNRAQRIH